MEEIDGYRFRLDDHTGPRRNYSRFYIVCKVHDKCGRWRGTGKRQRLHFGAHEPVAYLMAWAIKGRPGQTAKEHMKDTPSIAEIKAWLDSRG